MNNSALPYWLSFAVLLVALYGAFKWRQVQQYQAGGSEIASVDLPPLEEFELTDSAGQPFRSRDMQGKVWVVSFFFSTCPGTCSRLNANIKYLSSLPEIADVTWISVTVDPATDTQEVLAAKAEELGADPARWRFCRVDDFDYVKRVAHDLLKVGGVSYKGHNDFAVIIGKDGSVADYFNATSDKDSAKGVEKLKQCLAEKWDGSTALDGATSPSTAKQDAQPASASPPAEAA